MKMITQEELIEIFRSVEDPEIHIDIWTLGLIYDTSISKEGVKIVMTFTSPFCPYGPQLLEELQEKIEERGVKKVNIEVTFDPPWQPSEELREMLGM